MSKHRFTNVVQLATQEVWHDEQNCSYVCGLNSPQKPLTNYFSTIEGRSPPITPGGSAQNPLGFDARKKRYFKLLENKRKFDPDDKYIGESIEILASIERLQNVPVAVVVGPTGVGKSQLVEAVQQGQRPFVRLQASDFKAGDSSLVRQPLVGIAPNSGLSSVPREGMPGAIERCKTGTLFLDEFHRLPPEIFVLLLDVLDKKPLQKVGSAGNSEVHPDCQLVLASNANLEELVADGKIPHDFWDRVCRFQVKIPPLRERKVDICLFVQRLLSGFRIDDRVYLAAWEYDWPGNCRELRNVLESARADAIAAESKRITLDHLNFMPGEVIDRCRHARDAGKIVYLTLKAEMEKLGFQVGTGLQKEVGRILGMRPDQISRMVKTFKSMSGSPGP